MDAAEEQQLWESHLEDFINFLPALSGKFLCILKLFSFSCLCPLGPAIVLAYKLDSTRHVSLATRLRYFDTIITPVVCFAAGHRPILQTDLNKIDVTFRKLLRSVVGPPAATDWSRPWHEILHDWTARVVQFVEPHSVKHWSMRLEMHWKLAHYAANLPPDRWLARILTWTCRGHQNTGRPRNTWDRYQQLGNWLDVARDANRWSNLMPLFLTFCTQT